MKVLTNILAVIVGFLAASVSVYLIESVIGHNLFPLPEGADPMNMEWIKNNMDKIPAGAKVCVVIAHFIGIVIGMFIAAKISKTSMIPAYIVGAIMIIATFANIVMLPKELWFTISDGALTFIGFLLGTSIAKKQISNA